MISSIYGWAGGGYKYIYPCICITAYSCWAVCSLGPTVLEAEGSALIGKGSLSSHSEGKVSGATAAPPPRCPHQLCRTECTRFSDIPSAPTGLRELPLLPQLQKQPRAAALAPARSQAQARAVQVQGGCCASVSPLPRTSSLCQLHHPSPPATACSPRLSPPGPGLTGAGHKNELETHINPPVGLQGEWRSRGRTAGSATPRRRALPGWLGPSCRRLGTAWCSPCTGDALSARGPALPSSVPLSTPSPCQRSATARKAFELPGLTPIGSTK